MDPNVYVRDGCAKLRDVAAEQDYDLNSFGPCEVINAIDDVALLPELAEILESTPNDDVHHVAAFLLGALWSNTRDASVSNYLIEHLLARPRGTRAEHILWSLKGAPVPGGERLAALLTNSHKRLWFSVLDVLLHCPDAACEDEVIFVLQNARSHRDRWQAAWALRTMGTAKCIPALEERLFDKKEDVARVACSAIGEILGPQSCEFLLSLMENPKYRYKDVVAAMIVKHCDARAVPAIVKRVKALTSRTRSEGRDSHGRTELAGDVEFLERYAADCPDISKLYQLLKKRWRRLLACEREFLVGHIPAFSDVSWNVVDEFEGASPGLPHNVEKARALLILRLGHGVLEFDDRHPAHPLRRVVHTRDVDAQEVIDALRWFTSLETLALGPELRDEHLQTLGAMTDLRHLRLRRAGRITDAGVRHLEPLKNLLSLVLFDAPITDASLNWILAQWELNALNLSVERVSTEGWRRLMQLEKLTKLSLCGASDRGIAGIEGLHRLSWLRLTGSGISDATLARCEKIKSLSLLDLRNTNVSDDGLRYLAQLRQLRNVYLFGTRVTQQGADQLLRANPRISIDMHTPRE